MDYDADRIYYSHQNLQSDIPTHNKTRATEVEDDWDPDDVDLRAVRRHFREFLRNYRQKQRYVYRDRLLRMHQRTSGDEYTPRFYSENINPNYYCIEVDLAHVGEYDTSLLDLLLRQPAVALPPFEMAAVDALKTLLHEKGQDEKDKHTKDNQNNTQDVTGKLLNDDANSIQNENSLQTGKGHGFFFFDSSIQILILGNLAPTPLRFIQSQHMNTLLRCRGIVISASRVRSRATMIRIRCSRCQESNSIFSNTSPFSGISIPQRCMGPDPAECGLTPYLVVPDECTFVDQQTLKLQEAPEAVPTGEMPRSVLLAVERGLVDKCPPGTRVSVLAIASLFNSGGNGGRNSGSVKTVYLRVVGLQRDSRTGDNVMFTPREEESFRLLARRSDIYDILSRSIAPSISGSYTVDIKKAISCQLFSGSRKRLPDGMRLRGDINVLLLGDPSMAKSQFLKYTTRVAPVGVYTSGKGSSAAGLTASVVRDQRGEFYLEGGAMVLADGGIVAIDEFDKMRPADRVAIHEAMEQQTISVAKAGITTVLNSRSSVLAAANPVFGRYDDLKSASENIDLMSTILSRFDLIFLVRDVRDEERDKMICHHVMGVHINNYRTRGKFSSNIYSFGTLNNDTGVDYDTKDDTLETTSFSVTNSSPGAIAENALRVATTGVGELDVPTMKKYTQYCKAKCSPRLSEEAGDVLASAYVKIRDDVRKRALESLKVSGIDDGSYEDYTRTVIPITVRQLEALVRISESLAKMRLEPEVQSEDVAEALRLFKVSTMAANAADTTIPGSSNQMKFNLDNNNSLMLSATPSREDLLRAESFLRSRLVIGTVVNRKRIVEEASSQGHNAIVISKSISVMIMRGEVQERNQSRLIKRIK